MQFADLSMMNRHTLRVIGGGRHCAVFTDGRYVVKIGNVTHIAERVLLESVDCYPPIYGYTRFAEIDPVWQDLFNVAIPSYGILKSIRSYIVHNRADVIIEAFAMPLVSHTYPRSTKDLEERAKPIIDTLVNIAASLGITWVDCLVWNVGVIDGNPVILDV